MPGSPGAQSLSEEQLGLEITAGGAPESEEYLGRSIQARKAPVGTVHSPWMKLPAGAGRT